MKTPPKSLPLLPPLPSDEEADSSAITLKAWFCGCALCGAIASQEEA